MNFTKYQHENCKVIIDARWARFSCDLKVCMPIQKLRAIILSQNGKIYIPIQDTPHFNFIDNLVKGREDEKSLLVYKNYLLMHKDIINRESRVNDTKKLINELKKEEQKIYIVINKNGLIVDGVHRCCFLKSIGRKEIWCYVKK